MELVNPNISKTYTIQFNNKKIIVKK